MMDEYNMVDAELPTMVVRYKNSLVLRSIITGKHLEVLGPIPNADIDYIPESVRQKTQKIEEEYLKALEAVVSLISFGDPRKSAAPRATAGGRQPVKTQPKPLERKKSPANPLGLPPCKVQRNYCCALCAFYTQNPRSHLLHQRDVHGIRLSIHSCQHCQYASRYCQKLKRHIKMVHTASRLQQDTPILVEKPSRARNVRSTRNQRSIGVSKSLPQKVVPTKSVEERPSCSKAVKTSSTAFDIRNDPEAFFVLAYKNQLQKQFEYNQRLKKEFKSSNTKSSEASSQPCETRKVAANRSQSKATVKAAATRPSTAKAAGPATKNVDPEKKRMFSCRKCNYTTHIKSRFNKHVKYHSMPMIQCDKCEFRTTYKWNLTRHLRSHHGNGFYKCSICSFSANMKQSLTSHEANHHSPPIGRASGNRSSRRRRSRVGGSDLNFSSNANAQSNLNMGTNSSSERQESQVPCNANHGAPITAEDDSHSPSSQETTSNETVSPEQGQSNPDESPEIMDTSDSENFDIGSSTDESETDCNGFSENYLATMPLEDPPPLMTPPAHSDGDFEAGSPHHSPNDNDNHSFYSSNSSSTSSSKGNEDSYLKFANHSKEVQESSGIYSGYTSGSSYSTDTLSADETFVRSPIMPLSDTISPLSSYESGSGSRLSESFSQSSLLDEIDIPSS